MPQRGVRKPAREERCDVGCHSREFNATASARFARSTGKRVTTAEDWQTARPRK
jgi:hypothetical protein